MSTEGSVNPYKNDHVHFLEFFKDLQISYLLNLGHISWKRVCCGCKEKRKKEFAMKMSGKSGTCELSAHHGRTVTEGRDRWSPDGLECNKSNINLMQFSTGKTAQLFLFGFCIHFSHKLGWNPSEKLNTGVVGVLGVNASCNCCLLTQNQCSNGANKSYTWVSCRQALDKWCGRDSYSIWSKICNILFRFYEFLSIFFTDESWGLLSSLKTESCVAMSELFLSRSLKVVQPWISQVRSTADAVMFRCVPM